MDVFIDCRLTSVCRIDRFGLPDKEIVAVRKCTQDVKCCDECGERQEYDDPYDRSLLRPNFEPWNVNRSVMFGDFNAVHESKSAKEPLKHRNRFSNKILILKLRYWIPLYNFLFQFFYIHLQPSLETVSLFLKSVPCASKKKWSGADASNIFSDLGIFETYRRIAPCAKNPWKKCQSLKRPSRTKALGLMKKISRYLGSTSPNIN